MGDMVGKFKPEANVKLVGSFNSIKDMDQKPFIPQDYDAIYCTLENKYYIYKDQKWEDFSSLNEKIKIKGNDVSINLYELNKSPVSQLDDLIIDTHILDTLEEFKKRTNNKYYMLLCKDISYYTVFSSKDSADDDLWCGYSITPFTDSVIECAKNIGSIKAVEEGVGDSYEFWCLRPNGETVCAILFPYDGGIVKYA